jgi:hypothetical protein
MSADEITGNILDRLVAATVQAAGQTRRSGECLSPAVAWLVRDALEGPQLVGASWDNPVLALAPVVSELN